MSETPKCSICNWTNTGLLNLGEFGDSKWVCHGCIKRELDRLRLENARLAAAVESRESLVSEKVKELAEWENSNESLKHVLGDEWTKANPLIVIALMKHEWDTLRLGLEVFKNKVVEISERHQPDRQKEGATIIAYSPDAQQSIIDEERGERIAAELIAKKLKALSPSTALAEFLGPLQVSLLECRNRLAAHDGCSRYQIGDNCIIERADKELSRLSAIGGVK